MRVIAALVLCLLIAAVAALVLRRRLGLAPSLSGRRVARRLRLVEAMRISPQTQLCIVACDDRELLVAASASGTQLLQPLPSSRGDA